MSKFKLKREQRGMFEFLAVQVGSATVEGKELLCTQDKDIISSTPVHKDGIAPCNHKDVDTRIFIHIAHAASDGLLKSIIRTVDTDVVILAIANVHKTEFG